MSRRFFGNTAVRDGGGISVRGNSTLQNCLISGNTVAEHGGGLSNNGIRNRHSTLHLRGSTFSMNEAPAGGESVWSNDHATTTMTNCILWGDSQNQIGGLASATYTLIRGGGGPASGAGNIDADPLFVDADGPDDVAGTEDDDLRLQAQSPCINAGSNDALPPDVADIDGDGDMDEPLPIDLDGNPRITNLTVDMGAYEHPDCNANGVLDALDVSDGSSDDCNANTVPDECETDCNGNGLPDDCDLATGISSDCNGNAVPDECEPDCNSNGVPDDCDVTDGVTGDCNANGVPDDCEIAIDPSVDFNRDGVPDECGVPGDFDGDRDVDLADVIAFGECFRGAERAFLFAECQAFDFDGDGNIDLADFVAMQAAFTGPR